MTNLYYGEIVARISSHLFKNPEQIEKIDQILLSDDIENGNSVYHLCADAARVFNTLEDLASDHIIDWHKALDSYSIAVIRCLLQGQKPEIIDMITLASCSIQAVC